MSYRFQFRDVFASWPALLDGVLTTLTLSLIAMIGGLAIGVLGASAQLYGPKPLRILAASYVEAIRNTPLLIQLFIVFFGLPAIGIRLDAPVAAAIALTVNLGAYTTEIVRAGLQAVPRTQIEAGYALSLSGLQVFRYVVLFPALKMMFPALASQFVLLMLATSAVSLISVGDLFHAASIIQSRTFRDFEVYTVVGVVYLLLALALRAGFSLLYRGVFGPPMIRQFDWIDVAYLVFALRWTLFLAAMAFIGGGLVGLAVALLGVSGFAPFKIAGAAYVQVVQGIPLLVWIFGLYFGLAIFGVSVAPWLAAALAFSVYAGAFLGEIWRGAILAIPKTQWEAGASLGLGLLEQLRYIIAPQALRIATPPTVGFLVQLIKDTSLASTIGFIELTREGQTTTAATYQPFAVYLTVAGLYFLLCFPLTRLSRVLERRFHASP